MKKFTLNIGMLVAALLVNVPTSSQAQVQVLVGNLGLDSDVGLVYDDQSGTPQVYSWGGQAFQYPSQFTLDSVTIPLAFEGEIPLSDTYTLTATLESHDGDSPSGTSLGTFSFSSAPTLTLTDMSLTFDSPTTVFEANTPYWFVLRIAADAGLYRSVLWGIPSALQPLDGAGSLPGWSFSSDAVWEGYFTASPGWQVEVMGTAVPEPEHYVAVFALGLLAFGIGRQIQRRRAVQA